MTYETAVISRKLNPNSTFGVDWWELSELTVGSIKNDRLVGYSWADVRKGSRLCKNVEESPERRFRPIPSASPLGADLPGGVSKGLLLTRNGHRK